MATCVKETPAAASALWAGTMKLPLLCVLLVLAGVTLTQGGILNLRKMIKQMTGKSPVASYWFYGCYCGHSGRGKPLDATDRCCHTHDCCYAHLKIHSCRFYMDHYKYNMTEGVIRCSDKGSWCEQQLCECDKELALCLKRNMGTYNKKLRFCRPFRSHCKGEKLMC